MPLICRMEVAFDFIRYSIEFCYAFIFILKEVVVEHYYSPLGWCCLVLGPNPTQTTSITYYFLVSPYTSFYIYSSSSPADMWCGVAGHRGLHPSGQERHDGCDEPLPYHRPDPGRCPQQHVSTRVSLDRLHCHRRLPLHRLVRRMLRCTSGEPVSAGSGKQ